MSEPVGDGAYLRPAGKLSPADAAVALITDEHQRYLMQLRDAKPTIFFPDHWGCFGGALDPGESSEQAVRRELMEEIGLELGPEPLVRFTNFTFDFSNVGSGVINRTYFEVRVSASILTRLRLAEGREMRFCPAPELLRAQVVPYDRFAVWMHYYRRELAGAGST
jgi:8-oxo-dGTP diphosphatase